MEDLNAQPGEGGRRVAVIPLYRENEYWWNRRQSLKRLDTRLRGYDAIFIYLIFNHLLSFPRRRESRKMLNSDFLRNRLYWRLVVSLRSVIL